MSFFFRALPLFCVVGFFYSCSAPDEKQMRKNLQSQAMEMGEARMNKDYKKMVSYFYLPLIQKIGGEAGIVEQISEGTKKAELAGQKIAGITFGEPGPFVREAGEIQCVLNQQTTVSTPDGNSVNETSLIAISKDEGRTWTFMEFNVSEFFLMQADFPNLSSKLKLPGSAQEIFNDTISVR